MSEPLLVPRMERWIGTVLRVGVIASSVCLAVGLVLSTAGLAMGAASFLMNLGVVILLATPFARVIVSIVEYVSQRDWLFVVLTGIVLAELTASVILALVYNTRL